MKKVYKVLALGLLLSLNGAYGQGFKDKLKNKLNGGTSQTEGTKEWKSMDVVAASWESGQYFGRRENGGMLEPFGKKQVDFKKEGDRVVAIDIDGTTYGVGGTKEAPFANSYSKGNNCLYLTEGTIVHYRMVNGSSTNIDIEWVYGLKIGVGKAKKEIVAFRAYGESLRDGQSDDFAEKQAEEAKKKAAERKAKYSLEDKEVASVKIVNINTPEQFGHFVGFTFDVEATLKDGAKISTENGGFIEEYDIQYIGAAYDGYQITGEIIPTDEISVLVKLKKDPSKTDTKKVTVLYNQDVSFFYNQGSYRGDGQNGESYRIEIKQTKHASNGSDLLMIRVINVSQGGSVVSEFKMGIDQTLHFQVDGGNANTDINGYGQAGGNGGNIAVIKDPNVKYFNIDYTIAGGQGGKGESPSMAGQDGRDGTYKEEVRAVKF